MIFDYGRVRDALMRVKEIWSAIFSKNGLGMPFYRTRYRRVIFVDDLMKKCNFIRIYKVFL